MAWSGRPLKWVKESSGCIHSTSHLNRNYPEIMRNGERKTIARIIMLRKYGDQPKSIVSRHTCDDRRCINPAHIICGTIADNSRDMVERGRSAKGENVGGARLTPEKVLEIITLAGQKIPSRKIAKEFGISQAQVQNIKHRRTWKHLTENPLSGVGNGRPTLSRPPAGRTTGTLWRLLNPE